MTQTIKQTISKVALEIAKKGLSKDSKNKIQDYMYRGIDGLYDLLGIIFAENGLIILPEEVNNHDLCVIGKSSKGNDIYRAVVKVSYLICHAHGDDVLKAEFVGEAFDNADKATNKAFTAAYKYLMFQLFAIPINGEDNDADNSHHEVQATPKPAQAKPQAKPQVAEKLIQPKHEILQLFYEKKDKLTEDVAAKAKTVLDGDDTVAINRLFNYLQGVN